MRSFTTVDLLRDLKSVTHAAAREPVTITQHRKPRFVLMAVEDYEALSSRAADPRRAVATADMPPDIAAIFDAALDEMARRDQD
jgi:prevent-host-death family protein